MADWEKVFAIVAEDLFEFLDIWDVLELTSTRTSIRNQLVPLFLLLRGRWRLTQLSADSLQLVIAGVKGQDPLAMLTHSLGPGGDWEMTASVGNCKSDLSRVIAARGGNDDLKKQCDGIAPRHLEIIDPTFEPCLVQRLISLIGQDLESLQLPFAKSNPSKHAEAKDFASGFDLGFVLSTACPNLVSVKCSRPVWSALSGHVQQRPVESLTINLLGQAGLDEVNFPLKGLKNLTVFNVKGSISTIRDMPPCVRNEITSLELYHVRPATSGSFGRPRSRAAMRQAAELPARRRDQHMPGIIQLGGMPKLKRLKISDVDSFIKLPWCLPSTHKTFLQLNKHGCSLGAMSVDACPKCYAIAKGCYSIGLSVSINRRKEECAWHRP